MWEFKYVQIIGNGGYSDVIEVLHEQTGETYAMKIIDKKILNTERKIS